jgi:DNA-binding CsgD family transcriptional regulator
MLQERTHTHGEPSGHDIGLGLSVLARTDLTRREREVWLLMASGASDAEIAEMLALNSLTVRVHMSNALIKLGCASRQEAAALARQSGSECDGEQQGIPVYR